MKISRSKLWQMKANEGCQNVVFHSCGHLVGHTCRKVNWVCGMCEELTVRNVDVDEKRKFIRYMARATLSS